MAELNSFRWVELAVLAPGQSHYWFFNQPQDIHGWVFQATAYPEEPGLGEENTLSSSRVEVTELFILPMRGKSQGGKPRNQINITVTNCGDRWAPYSLWVASTPPPDFSAVPTVGSPLSSRKPDTSSCTPGREQGNPMKILVVHDEYGSIKSAAAAPSEPNRRAGLRSQRGELVTEVEEAAFDPEELRRRAHEFCETFRIDTIVGGLVRRNR